MGRDCGALSLALFVAACGCSKGPDVVPVKGTLSRGGKPLASFAVTFQPTQGRPSVALTDTNGNFELAYTLHEKGALRGTHKVFVQYTPIDTSYEQSSKSGRPADLKAIHDKYGNVNTTPLEVEIDRAKSVDLKLD